MTARTVHYLGLAALLIAGAPATKAEDLIGHRAWTNAKGQSMAAAVVSYHKDTVVFRMPDGKTVRYPMANLSETDQAVIRDAANPPVSEPKDKEPSPDEAAKAREELEEKMRKRKEEERKAAIEKQREDERIREAIRKKSGTAKPPTQGKIEEVTTKVTEMGVEKLFEALQEAFGDFAEKAPDSFWREFRSQHEDRAREQLRAENFALFSQFKDFSGGTAEEVAKVKNAVREGTKEIAKRAIEKLEEPLVDALSEKGFLDPLKTAFLKAAILEKKANASTESVE